MQYVGVMGEGCASCGFVWYHHLPDEEAQYCAILPLGEPTVRFRPRNPGAADAVMGLLDNFFWHLGLEVPTQMGVGLLTLKLQFNGQTSKQGDDSASSHAAFQDN